MGSKRPRKHGSEIHVHNLHVSLTRKYGTTTVTYDLLVSGEGHTGYAPVPCSNHDHPDFGDPGDPGYLDFSTIVVESNDMDEDEPIEGVWAPGQTVDGLTSQEINKLEDDALQAALERLEREYDDDAY